MNVKAQQEAWEKETWLYLQEKNEKLQAQLSEAQANGQVFQEQQEAVIQERVHLFETEQKQMTEAMMESLQSRWREEELAYQRHNRLVEQQFAQRLQTLTPEQRHMMTNLRLEEAAATPCPADWTFAGNNEENDDMSTT